MAAPLAPASIPTPAPAAVLLVLCGVPISAVPLAWRCAAAATGKTGGDRCCCRCSGDAGAIGTEGAAFAGDFDYVFGRHSLISVEALNQFLFIAAPRLVGFLRSAWRAVASLYRGACVGWIDRACCWSRGSGHLKISGRG